MRLTQAVLLGLLVAFPTSAAAAEDPLSFLGPLDPVVYKKEAGAHKGTVVVLLKNRSAVGGTLDLELIDPKGNTAVAGGKAVNGLRLAVDPTAAVRPTSVTSLTVTIYQPSAEAPVDVRLVARVVGDRPVGPAVVTLTPSAPASPTPAPLAFSQKQATMNVTRALGPLIGLARRIPWYDYDRGYFGDSVQIGTRGKVPEVVATFLNSDSGGTAQVVVRRKDRSSSVLAMRLVTDRGKYTGNVTIDPNAEKPRTLEVTLNVRDSLFWGLVALGAGVGLGALLNGWYETWRRRKLLQTAVMDSVAPYLRARLRNANRDRVDQDPPTRFYLDALLPADPNASPYPPKGGCMSSELRDVETLYCSIYEVENEEAFKAAAARIAETTARFDRWVKVEGEVNRLKQSLDGLPRESAMRADVRRLLLRTHEEPTDDKAAGDLIALLRAEARFAAVYRYAYSQFNQQDANWRTARPSVNPDTDLSTLTQKPVGTRTAPEINEILRPLLVKADQLREPSAIPPDPPPGPQRTSDAESLEGFAETLLLGAVEHRLMENVPELALGPPVVDTRSSREIYQRVRAADWTVFWVASALTGTVYILAKFDSDWGSGEDYLAAFAAGATVPTVAQWALLPFKRSYSGLVAAAPTSAPSTSSASTSAAE